MVRLRLRSFYTEEKCPKHRIIANWFFGFWDRKMFNMFL